jgi:hypothetical protein
MFDWSIRGGLGTRSTGCYVRPKQSFWRASHGHLSTQRPQVSSIYCGLFVEGTCLKILQTKKFGVYSYIAV